MNNSEKASGAHRAASQKPQGREELPPVGRVLRRAREHHGLAIREVERRTGRSSAYLSQVERGLIRQPDPVVLLELADLYKLDFMTLARWAGWTGDPGEDASAGSASFLVRRVLQLDDSQRAEVLAHIEELLRKRQR